MSYAAPEDDLISEQDAAKNRGDIREARVHLRR